MTSARRRRSVRVSFASSPEPRSSQASARRQMSSQADEDLKGDMEVLKRSSKLLHRQ
jgi:hypothetical protein